MKKQFIALALCAVVLFGVFAFVGCKTDEGKNKTVYEVLNDLAAKQRDQVTLTVVTTVGEDTLTSTYNATVADSATKVEYSVQSLAKLTADGATTARIETKSGSYVVKDGKVVQQNGQNCDIALDNVTLGKINFDKVYFKDVQNVEGKFAAKVVDADGFVGNKNATAMTVEVAYTKDAISSLKITYTLSNAAVTMTYTF